MAARIPRVPAREQAPEVRATNFDEVCYGYDVREAMEEASRCLHCRNPRCVASCPVNVKIPQFIACVAAGDFAGAASVIAEDSSLPAVCGRVCPQETQCEGSCVLGVRGEPVAIGYLERFVADWNRENKAVRPSPAPSNGYKVAVIGSGPAGLACASDLAKMGYEVTVFEALHKPGGVLEYGIPEFRLPKEKVVKPEIDDVRSLGVKIVTDVVAGRTVTVDSLLDTEGFSAVFIGSGAGLPRFMGIPGENLNGVFSANEFLTRNNLMKAYRDDYMTPVIRGHKVVVRKNHPASVLYVREVRVVFPGDGYSIDIQAPAAEEIVVGRVRDDDCPVRIRHGEHLVGLYICADYSEICVPQLDAFPGYGFPSAYPFCHRLGHEADFAPLLDVYPVDQTPLVCLYPVYGLESEVVCGSVGVVCGASVYQFQSSCRAQRSRDLHPRKSGHLLDIAVTDVPPAPGFHPLVWYGGLAGVHEYGVGCVVGHFSDGDIREPHADPEQQYEHECPPYHTQGGEYASALVPAYALEYFIPPFYVEDMHHTVVFTGCP